MNKAKKYLSAAGIATFMLLCAGAIPTSTSTPTSSANVGSQGTTIAAAPLAAPTSGTAPNGDPGGFGIDGDLLANTPLANVSDWLDKSGGTGVGLLNAGAPPIGGTPKDPTVTFQRLDGVDASDDVFDGSNKVNQDPGTWHWHTQASNDKTDMNNIYVHISQDSSGHRWITASGDRKSTNGTSYLDFELLQNTLTRTTNLAGCSPTPCGGFTSGGPNGGRTVGDLLFTANYGTGGSVATILVARWQASGGGFAYVDITSMVPNGSAFVATNTVDLPQGAVPYGAFGSTTYTKNQFVEMSVDLTALLGAISDPCNGIEIKSMMIKTKTSTSTTANMEDLTLPIQIAFSAGFVVDATGENPKCSTDTGGKVTATFSGGTGPYQCKLDNGSFATCTSPQTYNGVAAGSHAVTVKDTPGCTKTSNTVAITSPGAISFTTTTTNPSCVGTSTGSITVNASGGTGILSYSKDNGATFQASNVFSNLAAGTYNLVVKDSNACTKSGSATLTDPTAISFTTTPTNPNCAGTSTGSITVSASGGTGTLTYSKDNGATFQASNVFSTLAAGTYHIVVKDANTCTKSGDATLTDPAAISFTTTPTNPNCAGTSTGSITVSASGGSGTLTYSKDNGTTFQASNVFSNLAAGIYHIVVKDANTCTKSGDTTLTDPTGISFTTTPTNPNCAGASTGSITVSASGGTGTLTYSKDNGTTFQASNVFSNLAAGVYHIVVKDGNTCTKSGDTTLTDPAVISFTTTPVNPACNGGSTGSITVNASGGAGTLTYSKDNGATYQASNVFSTLAAGTYHIVVKDANLCTKSADTTLTDPAAISFTTTPANPNCAGTSTGSITVSASGGTGTLTYSDDNGTTFQASNVFSTLAAGTYHIVVKDANLCTKSADTTLTDPAAISFTTTPANPNCAGTSTGSITVSASGGTGTLTYSDDNGTTFQASNVFSTLAAGTYHIVVKDANLCTKSADTTLTDPAAISFTTTPANPNCAGTSTGSITVSASGGTGTLSYSDDNGATYQASNVFSTLAAGTYHIVVKDANLCTKSADTTLTDPAAISFMTTPVNPACNGASTGSITVSASGGTGTLSYSKDNGATFQASNVFSTLPAGTYHIVVKDANLCTKSADTTLTDPAGISFSATPVNPNCAGTSTGRITVSASGGTGTLTYSKDGGSTFQSSNVFNNLPAGTYSLVVKDNNGCTKPGSAMLTDPAAIGFTTTNANPDCAGASTGTITVNASGGSGTLTYSKDNGATFQASNVFSNLAAGTYNLVVKDNNGCINSGSATLTDPAVISFTTTPVNPACAATSTGSITVNASGGTGTLTYSKDGGTNFQASNVFNNLAAGTYNLVVKDANGCTDSDSATLTDPAPVTLSLQKACSNGSDGSITATASGGTGTLTYSKDGTNFQASNVFTGLAAGTYTITVKDANNCRKSAQISVDTCVCNPLSACTPPYPFTSSNPRTNIAFNESEVLRAFIATVGANCTPSQIQVFYNDEHALTLGVNKVTVKTTSGTTITNYDVTPLSTNPGSKTDPMVGSTIQTGPQAGTDVSGRPMYPALFITDVTNDPNSIAGDWQSCSTANPPCTGIPPHAVFGTWKAAAKLVDQTKNPAVVTVTPASDPAKNNWNLVGPTPPTSDPVPTPTPKNEGYGAEARWDVSRLGLTAGHKYRLYFMVHDGDQNKTGGDSGQACVYVTIP